MFETVKSHSSKHHPLPWYFLLWLALSMFYYSPPESLIREHEGTLLGQLIAVALIALFSNAILLPFVNKEIHKFHSRHEYWNHCQKRKSHFGPPASKELVWNSVSCIQHFSSGSLMTAGWFLGQEDSNRLILFRLGVIAEVAFEILDIIDMVRETGPWKDPNHEIAMSARVFVLAHHLPGVMLVFPLNLWCSCVELWQRCAIGLEVGGGIGLLFSCLRESFRPPTAGGTTASQRLGLFAVDLGSLIFFVWTRFLVITPAMYTLIVEGLKIHCKTTYALILGAILMTAFNLGATMVYLDDVYSAAMSMITDRDDKKEKVHAA